jgi:hypothetical protein
MGVHGERLINRSKGAAYAKLYFHKAAPETIQLAGNDERLRFEAILRSAPQDVVMIQWRWTFDPCDHPRSRPCSCPLHADFYAIKIGRDAWVESYHCFTRYLQGKAE